MRPASNLQQKGRLAVNEASIETAEANVRSIPRGKRAWVLPILRALDQMGGSGRPKDVINKALEYFAHQLTEKDLTDFRDNSKLGWTRLDLVRCGLLGGDRGLWRLTALARLYLDAHQNDALDLPRNSSPKKSGEDSELTEVVSVSETRAYEVPILGILRNGRLLKEEILTRVYGQLKDRLLPGDTRLMPHTEMMVAHYRAGRAITNLWRDGRLKNPARGYWEITQKGRDRLRAEEAFFNLAMFQGTSKATVLLSSTSCPRGSGLNLESLKAIFGPGLHHDLRDHLQLEQGPTPTNPQGLTRNIIFYGPPGVGKTRLAKMLAQALTEEDLPGTDSRWRLVQFHPSYTYQEFIQGLRPSLESTGLSYIITTGPFMEICAHAEAEPDRYFAIIIDEINRGEPARIFGELIYGLEYRGEEVQLSLEATLRVPPNLIVIGTMNSADRTLALTDYALRRRFGFFRVEPDPEVVSDLMVGNADLAAGLLEGFNTWLEQTLGREHTLGHSVFLNPNYHPFTAATIERIWRLDVLPLMEEYFSGQPALLTEARAAWKRAIATSAAKLARGS